LNDIVSGRAMLFMFVVMACSAVLVVVGGLGKKMDRGDRNVSEEVLAKKKLE
jgi:hypothetical protein